jgi:hypothetical protein
MYGSLINNLYDNSKTTAPEVGMGATILMWSDRHAATITEITYFKSGAKKGQPRTITVQQDKATRTDNLGMSDAQSWEFKRDENGTTRTFTAKKDGSFKGLLIGHRSEYYDFSF